MTVATPSKGMARAKEVAGGWGSAAKGGRGVDLVNLLVVVAEGLVDLVVERGKSALFRAG